MKDTLLGEHHFKNIWDLLECNPLAEPEFNTLHHKALLNEEYSFVPD